MIGIFLDDERNPEDVKWVKYPANVDWCVVRRMSDFTSILSTKGKFPDDMMISFDHDLQDFTHGEENTGYDCLKWLINYCIDNGCRMPKCYFHTMNPVGKANMENLYNNFVHFEEEYDE